MTEERSRGVLTSAGGVPILDCSPDESPHRAVVVLHDAAGATGQNDSFTGRFADLGYRAVAPNSTIGPVIGHSITVMSRAWCDR